MSADARFFGYAGPLSLTTIVAATGGASAGDPTRLFSGVASLAAATPDEVSFCEAPRYVPALKDTAAGAVFVTETLAEDVPKGCIAVICRSPPSAFARLASLFHPAPRWPGRIDPTAIIAEDAVLGEGCEIGPMAIIGSGARIGDGCQIGPLVTVGPGVVLGRGCVLHSHVSISHAVCGEEVILHPGARIGQEGFGFSMDLDGRFRTAPQLGIVEIGRGSEIGANTCIDRGSLGNTVLGEGTRLDNLVQIGHNVRTGRNCILVAQSGVSGSTVLGDHVSVGGQAGFSGHLSIGSGARVAGQSGVIADLEAGAEVFGTPSRPIREAFRSLEVLRRLTAESRRVRKREAE